MNLEAGGVVPVLSTAIEGEHYIYRIRSGYINLDKRSTILSAAAPSP